MKTKKYKRLSDKHPGKSSDSKIEAELSTNCIDGNLPCAVAFAIATRLAVSPAEVGITCDLLNIKISKCQIGLFGYQPHNKVVTTDKAPPVELKEALITAQAENRITCETAWGIAARLKIGKIAVGCACEAMGIRINACQIGAF